MAAIVAALAASSLLVAGCGGETAEAPPATATAPAAAPVAVAAVGLGGEVTAGPSTPKAVARALRGSGVVVVSMVVKGVADDDRVAEALAAVRSDPGVSKDVAFFHYAVGADKLGDLADKLGVKGTPAVAVIGRDRTLVNLWTGLVDAEILRQSIADAADTAAANPGAKAVSGSQPTSSSAGPTGDAEGIALAKEVNASYEGVPGVRLTGEVKDDDFGKGNVNIDAALEGGLVTAAQGTLTFDGFPVEFLGVSKKTYTRGSGSACWSAAPDTGPERLAGAPLIETIGRFKAPSTADGVTTLWVTRALRGKAHFYSFEIDSATNRVRTQTEDGATLKVVTLDSTPSIAGAPTDLCATPQEAFDSLPSTAALIRANITTGCTDAGSSASACGCVADKMIARYPTAGDIRKAEAGLKHRDEAAVSAFTEIREACGIA